MATFGYRVSSGTSTGILGVCQRLVPPDQESGSPDPSILALPSQGGREHIPDEALARMRRLSDAGLIEYDGASAKIQASQLLEESRVSPAGAKFVDICSWISTIVLLGFTLFYLAIPINLIPEVLAGPVGYIDDAILVGLSLLPMGKRVIDA